MQKFPPEDIYIILKINGIQRISRKGEIISNSFLKGIKKIFLLIEKREGALVFIFLDS